MNADEKRKVFEELLEEYQNHIESEFSYEDGKREAERKVWLNKYDGIKEPLIKDEKIRKAVRAWAELNNIKELVYIITGGGLSVFTKNSVEIDFTFQVQGVQDDKHYTIAELCGEEEE